MPNLGNPDLEIDRLIIADFRMAAIKESGLIDPSSAETIGITPFNCPSRGYVIDQNNAVIVMFDPFFIDPADLIPTIHNAEPPYEIFIPEDDQITAYCESP